MNYRKGLQITEPNHLPRIARALMRNKQKYGARRTFSELCGREFDSKAECIRGEELALLEKASEITDLRYQIPFVLNKSPKITIKIDFCYLEQGKRIYEDVKGVLTRDSRTKLAWLKEKYGVDVKLYGLKG